MALSVFVAKVEKYDCCICECLQVHEQTLPDQDYIPWLVSRLVKHNLPH